MTDQRFIIEMGQGVDLHGMDYQKAATRAIRDALSRATLPIFETLGISHDEMRVAVTIAVQAPDEIDTEALVAELPRGRASVTATFGGLNVDNPATGDTAVIATAAVEAFLTNQAANWRASGP